MTGAQASYRPEDYDTLGGVRDAIVRKLALADGALVLDVGTGTGHFAHALAKGSGSHVLGIDIVPGYVATAAHAARALGLAGRCRFAVSDLRALPARATGFAAVTSFLGLCELLKQCSAQQALAAMAERLHPGGQVVIVDQLAGDARNDRQQLGVEVNLALGYRYSSLDDITAAADACGLTLTSTWTETTGRPVLDLAGAYRYFCDEYACNVRDGTPAPDPMTLWQRFRPQIARAGGIEIDAVLRVFVLASPRC